MADRIKYPATLNNYNSKFALIKGDANIHVSFNYLKSCEKSIT